MLSRRRLLLGGFFTLALPLPLPLASLACSAPEDVDAGDEGTSEEPLTRVTADEQAAAARESLSGLTFERLTSTSTRIVKAARWWMKVQEKSRRYPMPRMCASNVAKVLFLAGLYGYDQEGVRALIGSVRQAGGRVVKLPDSEAAMPAALSAIDGGKLPAGTLVAGMHVSLSRPGDQHIGIVGHTDPDGTVWLYHNNWYRPENEGGARRPFMVSEQNLARGFPRQWMATPWLRLTRDTGGRLVSVQALMPRLDDMNPYDPSYDITLAILPEVASELRATR